MVRTKVLSHTVTKIISMGEANLIQVGKVAWFKNSPREIKYKNHPSTAIGMVRESLRRRKLKIPICSHKVSIIIKDLIIED